MILTPIRTRTITSGSISLDALVDQYLPAPPAHSIVAVSSKIVSLCEGRTMPMEGTDRDALIRAEADYYRAPSANPYHYAVTITRGHLVGSAGVDASNGGGHYVLWPADPQATANQLRAQLTHRAGGPVGIIITDSRTTPLRRGATGFGLAHSGFAALADYRGTADLFGHPFQAQIANLLDGLAAAAVAIMGEGAESTPLVLIEDAPVQLQDHNPTPAELATIKIPPDQDVFADLLAQIPWDKRPL